VPASSTDYYRTCYLEHIDDDVDMVIIELGINDQRNEKFAIAYEQLLRSLLTLPNKPAVVNLQVIALRYDQISTGEDLHLPIAAYYDTPVVNLRNFLLPHILRASEQDVIPLEKHWFSAWVGYVDTNHISEAGHHLLNDLFISMTQRVLCQQIHDDTHSIKFANFTQISEFFPSEDTLEQLPRLSLLSRYDHNTTAPFVSAFCRSMSSKKHPLTPEKSQGWERWHYPSRPDKVYLRATEAGSTISFKVRTEGLGVVRLTYLRSKTFGLGNALCWIDNHRDQGRKFWGWWTVDNVNLLVNDNVAINLKPGEYTMTCEVLEDTSDPGGGHEFRIVGIDGG